jgi:hypothetical protein
VSLQREIEVLRRNGWLDEHGGGLGKRAEEGSCPSGFRRTCLLDQGVPQSTRGAMPAMQGESRHPRLIAQDPRFESRSASSVGATGIDASVLLAMGDGT